MELQAPIMYIHIDTKNTHKTNFSYKTKNVIPHHPTPTTISQKKKKNILLICIYKESYTYANENNISCLVYGALSIGKGNENQKLLHAKQQLGDIPEFVQKTIL